MSFGYGVADIDLDKLLAFHRSHGKIAIVTGVSPASEFDELQISGNRVEHLREKPSGSDHYVSGGFYVFNRLTTNASCDLEAGSLEEPAAQGELRAYKHPGRWACIDTEILLVDDSSQLGMHNSRRSAWGRWEM